MGGSGSKKKLSKEDMDFLIDNTNFTKHQIKQWYKGFMVSKNATCMRVLDMNSCLCLCKYMVFMQATKHFIRCDTQKPYFICW